MRGIIHAIFGSGRKRLDDVVGAPVFVKESVDLDHPDILHLPRVYPPNMPWGFLYRKQRFWRGLKSAHTRDLFIFFILMSATTLIFFSIMAYTVITEWKPGATLEDIIPPQNLIIGGSAIAVYLGTGFAIFMAGKKRFALVDIISSEIIHLMRGVISRRAFTITGKWLDQLHKPGGLERVVFQLNAPTLELGNYLANFHRNTEQIGALNSTIVDHVTEFYTLYKLAQDEIAHVFAAAENCRRCIAEKGPESAMKTYCAQIEERLINRLYLGDNAMIAAYNAEHWLLGDPNHRIFAKQMALSLGIQANTLLCRHILASPNRSNYNYKLMQALERRFYYRELAKDLRRERSNPKAGPYRRLEKLAAGRNPRKKGSRGAPNEASASSDVAGSALKASA